MPEPYCLAFVSGQGLTGPIEAVQKLSEQHRPLSSAGAPGCGAQQGLIVQQAPAQLRAVVGFTFLLKKNGEAGDGAG